MNLSPGSVHVLKASLDHLSSSLEILKGTLSIDERERYERLYSDRDRKRFLAGRGMLRVLLGKYLGIKPHQVIFSYLENGKPFLLPTRSQKSLQFSLSHSHEMVLYAFALDSSVGIDLERLRKVENMNGVIKHTLSSRESTHLFELSEKERMKVFFRFWTCKEAVIKSNDHWLSPKEVEVFLSSDNGRSTVLKRGMGHESVSCNLVEFEPFEQYWAALCMGKNIDHISYFQWIPLGA